MTREDFIRELIVSKYGNIKSFSEQIGIPYTTVRSILERGIGNAGVDNVIKICNGLNIKPEQLAEEGNINEYVTKTLSAMYLLPEDRQKIVYDTAQKQLREQEIITTKVVPLVGKSAANPTVLGYGDTDIEQQSFAHVPDNADCAIYIQGDSMEPLIKNGSIVFYKKQCDVENGEIAIVEIDGDGVTCKKLIKDYENERIILRSINKKYDDRVLKSEEIRIIGKVVV